MRVLLAIMIGAGMGAGIVCADSTTRPSTQPSTQPDARIVQWVADLTSAQFAVREAAQQNLEHQGDWIVPELQRMLQGTLTDEARARIRAAIHNIQERERFGPSSITIHCQDAPLEGVLEDFAHQAGDLDMGVDRPEIRQYLQTHKITLNLDHANFWSALLAIQDACGLHAHPDNNGRLIFDNMPGFSFEQLGDLSKAKEAGPCVVMPERTVWSVDYRSGGNINSFNLQLVAMIEPKLFIVGGYQSNWVREVTDDKGHSLLLPAANSQGFFAGPRQLWMILPVNLHVVPGMGNKIARLKGELSFTIRVKHETIEVDNILSAKNVTRSAGGSTVTIRDVTNANGQYQLHLLASGAPGTPPWAIFQNPGSSLNLVDEKGQPFQQISMSQNNNEYTMTFIANAPDMGPPTKLRWDVTTETRQMTVPFELNDIELPHAPPEGAQ
jgi:hypothetical protein